MTTIMIVIAFLLGIWAGAGWGAAVIRGQRRQIEASEIRAEQAEERYAELYLKSRDLVDHIQPILERAAREAA